MSAQTIGRWLLVTLSLALEGKARAYTVSSPITQGCHELITTDALRTVRLELTTARPLPADENDQALIADLQFTPDADLSDLGGATLLIGVRDNDLKGGSSSDLTQLAVVQGNPSLQVEHCLRDPTEHEPGGTQLVLTNCRGFIQERIQEALTGLDSTGTPDPTNRISLPLHLSLRGGVNALLPVFYVRMGQALHTIQDSFAHSYRTPDGLEITTSLDWLDEVDGTLNESIDGPGHELELDRCDDPDPLRTLRRHLATDVSTDVLRTSLDPSLASDEKLLAINALLDKFMTFSAGCNYGNAWCHAPEHAYGTGIACSNTGSNAPLAWMVVLLFLASLMRRRKPRRYATGYYLFYILLAAGFTSSTAQAQEHSESTQTSQPALPPPPNTTPVAEAAPADPDQVALGGYLGLSASVSNGALAGTLGARLRASTHWTFGLDAEWNPWLAYDGTLVRPGSFNLYGTAIVRFPLAYEHFNLRITGSLGMSRLLMYLYGAPEGSTGVYLGISPLGIEWKIGRIFYLVVNPLNFAAPAPQLRGVPFIYPQYRFTIGLETYTH